MVPVWVMLSILPEPGDRIRGGQRAVGCCSSRRAKAALPGCRAEGLRQEMLGARGGGGVACPLCW